jgi:adenylosuccinate lyase
MPSPLSALSPLDGRYHKQLAPLTAYCSEAALIRYRVRVEIEWLIALAQDPGLAELRPFSTRAVAELRQAAADFAEVDAARVKEIEARTNHDVKAVEYWLKERFAGHAEVAAAAEFIHFACTSEDINNLAQALMLADAREQVLLPALDGIVDKLRAMAHTLADAPMLARTHGQAATPTTLGK